MSLTNLTVMQHPTNKSRRETKKARVSLTVQELLTLLKAAQNHSPRAHAGILLQYKHGLRCGEICNLRLGDVTLDVRGKTNSIIARRLKGSLTTTQPLTKQIGQPLLDEPRVLREWLAIRNRNDASDYFFVSNMGGRMDESCWFRIFQKVAKAAGLPTEKQHSHILKHSRACHLIAKATNIAFVQQALGHASISSTMVYASISDAQASAEMMRIDGETF